MKSKPTQLHAEQIEKQFKQGTSVIPVLKGVTVTFTQGGRYAITGVSGSGKSTFLHILAGLDAPDKGAIFFDGVDIATYTRQEKEQFLNRSVGLMFQQPYLLYELSVLENVMLKGLIARQEYEICVAQALELLDQVGLKDKAHVYPASLSGGQQQRVALVRALFNKPAFLLADEPTGSLDLVTGRAMVQLLLECQKRWSMGLIICSHEEYVVEAMSEVWHMEQGILKKHRG